MISLRAQPERITKPIEDTVILDDFDKFGFLIESKEPCKIWKFDFYINHNGVFYENGDELGALTIDCAGVPMIKLSDKQLNLPDFLDTSPELRNIFFEVLNHE